MLTMKCVKCGGMNWEKAGPAKFRCMDCEDVVMKTGPDPADREFLPGANFKASLRLVSDGTPSGTRIIEESSGRELSGIRSYSLSVDPGSPRIQWLTITVAVIDPMAPVPGDEEAAGAKIREVAERIEARRREMFGPGHGHTGPPPQS